MKLQDLSYAEFQAYISLTDLLAACLLLTHLSLCVIAACVSRPCIIIKMRSSRVASRCAIPSCTCRLPENRMAFKNANTSLTISSFECDNRGITYERSQFKVVLEP